jgi:hypothetical protein
MPRNRKRAAGDSRHRERFEREARTLGSLKPTVLNARRARGGVYRIGESNAQFNTTRTVRVEDPSSAGLTRRNRPLTGLTS